MPVLVDSVGPVQLRVIVRAPVDGLDLSTVTAANIRARKPRLSEVTGEAYVYADWVPSVAHVSATVIVLTYPFEAGDVDRIGDYRLAIDLTVPAGIVPCTPVKFSVLDRY